ncbi:MAG: hypothetical protein KDK41_04490 [Leptospiraceae bacterium]|nr:hypothetical protein [Leptospiraceae bacterium]MCB1199880.1 hypothetical protein [Leptospiraceae bacterium]
MSEIKDGGFIGKVLGKIDIIAAVLLGLGTVTAAFAAYQSSLWGGNCLTAYNEAVIKFGDANREYLNGSMNISFDTMIYLESLRENPRTADDVDKMMAKDLVRAVKWSDTDLEKRLEGKSKAEIAELESQLEEKWEAFYDEETTDEAQAKLLDEIEVIEKQIDYQPFLANESYRAGKRSKGDALTKAAQAKMKEGITANMTGDSFTLLTVYFTISLFFAGLASVLKDDKIKFSFTAGSTLVFLFALVQMLFLPFA